LTFKANRNESTTATHRALLGEIPETSPVPNNEPPEPVPYRASRIICPTAVEEAGTW
jgi:hypothetical protein